jgi:hypothetical protein
VGGLFTVFFLILLLAWIGLRACESGGCDAEGVVGGLACGRDT